MALDELTRNIEQEAKAEASRLGKEASSESSAIIENAKKLADALKKKRKEEAEVEVDNKKRDVASALEIESNEILSSAREESVDRHLPQLNAIIKKKFSAKESEIIKNALKRFSDIMPLDNAIVKIDKSNAKLVKANAKIENASITGVVITSSDGKVKADATIESLMDSNLDAIRRILSKELGK
ncbi:MAG: hypothetical protein ABR981_03475 [Candidatus Micrarchaeaceae archaeon]|jgi:vacuolar-type H+-ATPase subunit E/Vma4